MEKRNRVKGSGPSRELVKTIYKLGTVSEHCVAELNQVLHINKQNDIGGDNYAITQNIDCVATHNLVQDKYRQVLIQKAIDSEILSEFSYTEWDKTLSLENTISAIKTHFKKVYRFRVSETQPLHEIKWHIDTNTSVACRAQICLTEDDSIFEFKDRHGIQKLHMKPGELWFINTGWNHRVLAGEKVRRVAIFTFEFDDVYSKDKLLI